MGPEVFRHGPEAFLSRSFMRQYPDVWRSEVEPFLRSRKHNEAKPTATHWFCAWLYRQGWLKRIYTQNVDGLHSSSELGLPEDLVVECHGALRDGSLVMYDDPMPRLFNLFCKRDFESPSIGQDIDLLLVFGTSLRVAPFCTLPNLVPRGCTRVLVNKDLQHCLRNHGSSKSWCDESSSKRWRQILIESDSDAWVDRFFASPVAQDGSFCLPIKLPE